MNSLTYKGTSFLSKSYLWNRNNFFSTQYIAFFQPIYDVTALKSCEAMSDQ